MRKFLLLALAAFSLLLYASSSVAAQVAVQPIDRVLSAAQLARQADGKVSFSERTNTGVVSFVRVAPGGDLMRTAQSRTAEGKSKEFFAAYGALFGITDPAVEVMTVDEQRDYLGNQHVTYQQFFQGVEVFGAQLKTHFGAGLKLTAVNGVFVTGVDVNTAPSLGADAAGEIALQAVAAQFGATASGYAIANNHLLVYRTGLAQGIGGLDYLTYKVEVVNYPINVREFVFVDAHSGKIVDQITGVTDALQRQVSEVLLSNVVWQEGDVDPITPGLGTVQQVADWQNEIDGARETYNLFASMAGRDSYDGAGASMRTVNNAPAIFCPNASWNGISTNYCTNVTGDDTVAHEWGHAYTEHTSNLIYAWQSGALNESYSDIWGEVVDLLNGRGTDAPDGPRSAGSCSVFGIGLPSVDNSYRWLQGEDAPAFGGAIRDMWNPTCYGNPGKVTDAEYECTGDVHHNSGVPNHAFALMVDGGTYNGQTIAPLGLTKAAHIHWYAQANILTLISDFAAQADALLAACTALTGVNLNTLSTSDLTTGIPSAEIISAADCDQVTKVIDAVEFRTDLASSCGFTRLLQPDAPPLCTSPEAPKTLLLEEWESGSLPAGWTVGKRNVAVPSNVAMVEWTVVGSLPSGAVAGSTKAAFVANPLRSDNNCLSPEDNMTAVFYLESPSFVVTADAMPLHLAFDHWVATEAGWDGGNVKVSVNGGPWTLIPAAAYTFNAYNSILTTILNTNPMVGEAAFTGSNDGGGGGSWGQSQIDLTGLVAVGDSVKFRFEEGQDACYGLVGWYVDDVRAYTCLPAQIALVPGDFAASQEPGQQVTETLTIQSTGGAELDWSIKEAAAVTGTCDTPSDLPWLSVSPISGTTPGGTQTDVSVSVDSSGLANGTYSGKLCIASNDSARPQVQVPITLTVIGPPAVPSALTASGVSQTEIDLRWTDNSDDESSFKVERSPDGSTGWQEIGTVAANMTSTLDLGLTCATTYYYQVAATNAQGDSAYSNIANAQTVPCPSATVTVNATPSTLVADGESQSEITAIVEDASGNRVPNQAVTFVALRGTIEVSATTDMSGTAGVKLTADTAIGTAQITATAGVVSGASQVLFVAGPPASITLSASPPISEIPEGVTGVTLARSDAVTLTITALISDSHENPVSGEVVTFTTTIGMISPTATTDVAGIAKATLSLETSADNARVTAQAGDIQNSHDVVIQDLQRKKLFLPMLNP